MLPVIGGHVDIGAGAKILGNVHVGDHASIGANAVVLNSLLKKTSSPRRKPGSRIL
jgi:serine O-acetyltransferase